VATKLHNLMSGADLHPNAIDGTTGTELTPASQTTYDTRYVRTIGGTVTPTANGTGTLVVNRQDGTTAVLTVDTSNNNVAVGNGGSGTIKLGDNTFSKATGSFFNFNSGLKIAGPLQQPITTKTAAYTIGATDSNILADGTSATLQVTLPSASGLYANALFTIKRINSAANNITVGPTSSQTIDGAATKTLGSQYAWITVQSNGTSWFIISQGGTVS